MEIQDSFSSRLQAIRLLMKRDIQAISHLILIKKLKMISEERTLILVQTLLSTKQLTNVILLGDTRVKEEMIKKLNKSGCRK